MNFVFHIVINLFLSNQIKQHIKKEADIIIQI